MLQPDTLHEEHELPAAEAVLAGTLALMTGYGQSLLADHGPGPGQRMLMGHKIERNLDLLAGHPALSAPFRRILASLRLRWQAMDECTALAAVDVGCGPFAAAPKRLQ